MRSRIRVTDLNLRQWGWLQSNVLVEYQFAPFEPRACVEFELSPDLNVRHVEMPLPAFTGLMMVLQSLGLSDTATAALSPDALPDTLEGQRNAADPQRAAERTPEDITKDLTGERPSWSADRAGCTDPECAADHSVTRRPL